MVLGRQTTTCRSPLYSTLLLYYTPTTEIFLDLRAKIMLSVDSEEWHSCLETFMSKDPALERQERVLVSFHYFHLSCFTVQLHCFAFLQFLWATILSSILLHPKIPKNKVRNRKYNISHDRDRSLRILPLFWVKKRKLVFSDTTYPFCVSLATVLLTQQWQPDGSCRKYSFFAKYLPRKTTP